MNSHRRRTRPGTAASGDGVGQVNQHGTDVGVGRRHLGQQHPGAARRRRRRAAPRASRRRWPPQSASSPPSTRRPRLRWRDRRRGSPERGTERGSHAGRSVRTVCINSVNTRAIRPPNPSRSAAVHIPDGWSDGRRSASRWWRTDPAMAVDRQPRHSDDDVLGLLFDMLVTGDVIESRFRELSREQQLATPDRIRALATCSALPAPGPDDHRRHGRTIRRSDPARGRCCGRAPRPRWPERAGPEVGVYVPPHSVRLGAPFRRQTTWAVESRCRWDRY